MKVVMIGSGNVATVLSRLFIKNGHSILQVISRNIDHARALADELNVNYSDLTGQPDECGRHFYYSCFRFCHYGRPAAHAFHDKLIVHTAGSVSREVLKALSASIMACFIRCKASFG